MTAEAPSVDECFSEAPLVPRRLSFYESQASHEVVNGLSRPEAPSELVAALAKAFVAMVGRRARLELRMQVTKAKVDQLNRDVGGELVIPPDICGDFTIVRYFNQVPTAATSMNQHPVSPFRLIINKDIEASIIAQPNHSLASDVDGSDITVTEEQDDSDYVSTLRDPGEEQ